MQADNEANSRRYLAVISEAAASSAAPPTPISRLPLHEYISHKRDVSHRTGAGAGGGAAAAAAAPSASAPAPAPASAAEEKKDGGHGHGGGGRRRAESEAKSEIPDSEKAHLCVKSSADIVVGDIVRVYEGEEFPADLILLSSSSKVRQGGA